MGLAETLLSALAYPKAQSFNADDESSYRRLIAWLENVKVCDANPKCCVHIKNSSTGTSTYSTDIAAPQLKGALSVDYRSDTI